MFNRIKQWFGGSNNSVSKYPGEDWLTSAREEAAFTPDLCDLEARQIQHLFLPCELQDRHIRGELTSQGGAVLWKGFTKGDFSLYRDREDNSAIFLNEPRHKVKGEVWAIVGTHISKLDNYKENGVLCTRQKIDVRIPYTRFIPKNRTTKGQSEYTDIPCWAYISSSDLWKDKLDNGFRYPPIRLFRPNNPFLKPFYYYKPDEIAA